MALMNTPSVDTDIPPPVRSRGGSQGLYQFGRLAVGNSLFITADTPRARASARSAARMYGVRHPGWNYQAKTVTEDGIKGLRVWRIA